jgi:hypothetical protein
MEDSNGQMDPSILANSLTTTLRVLANTSGLMEELIMETGKIIKCTEKECSLGPMAEDMRVNI